MNDDNFTLTATWSDIDLVLMFTQQEGTKHCFGCLNLIRQGSHSFQYESPGMK